MMNGISTATIAAAPLGTRHRTESHHDFDLHGMVGIRLVDASASDRATVAAQLGPITKPLDRAPDIVIRFVDRLQTSVPLRLVGVGEAAYDDDAFLILRSRHKTPARVRIAFDEIGGPCEIVCERGLPAVPLLLAIINLTVLAKGGLALHATAFRYRDRGILVTGWSKSGKTETLLAFLEHGAEYVGDEWIYLSPDGETMFGVPEPVRVWDWQLSQLPHYRQRLNRNDRLKLRALQLGSGGLDGLARVGSRKFGRHVQRVRGLLERQRYAFLRPESAFAGGASASRSTLDQVFFLANSEADGAHTQRVDAGWIADRMTFSMEEERAPLMAVYRQFRFAFPHRPNVFLESVAALEMNRMRELLAGHPCHAVYHPYPPSILGLYDTIAPLLST